MEDSHPDPTPVGLGPSNHVFQENNGGTDDGNDEHERHGLGGQPQGRDYQTPTINESVQSVGISHDNEVTHLETSKITDQDSDINSFVSFSSHISTAYDTMLLAHSQNLRSEIDNIKLNFCDTLRVDIDQFAAITPKAIKNCPTLNKFTLADSLLSLLTLSEKVCAIIGGRRVTEEEAATSTASIAQVTSAAAVSAAMASASSSGNSVIHDSLQAIHQSILDIKANDGQAKVLESIQQQLDTLTTRISNYSQRERGSNVSTPDFPPDFPPPFRVSFPNQESPDQVHAGDIPCLTSYKENFIDSTTSTELKDYLDSLGNKFDENTESGHSVISFGESYSYTGAKAAVPISKEFPDAIANLLTTIKKTHRDCVINQCLVNRYLDKDSLLPQHSDDEESIVFGSQIFTVSVGGTRAVTFRKKDDSEEEVVHHVAGNSMYVMSRASQDFWSHRIDPSSEDCSIRYSITFRYITKHNDNVTVILGDSNTAHLKFGSGRRTFGDNMPGKRIPCFTLEQIKPHDCVGYKNIFIHCGINDIKQRNANVQEAATLLSSKVDQIRRLCPSSKIVVSPILPTKSESLNNKAVAFNRILFDFCSVNYSIGTLDFSGFCDDQGLLDKRFGRYFACDDMIHLGSTGIFTLSRLIARKIFGSPADGRLYSQVASINQTNHRRRSHAPSR
jgi:alkylated DNA repair dioxygenase AlkB